MNVFVTGATGFIGSHLCKELVRREYDVFALTHSGRIGKLEPLLVHRNFHLLKGDIRHIDALYTIMSINHIDSVCHLAAHISSSTCNFDTNANGTLNMLEVSYYNNISKFIYASTMSVYAEPPQYISVDERHTVQPTTVYGVSKLTGELLCNLYSTVMDITILRYSGAYGRGQRKSNAIPTFFRQALNNEPITIHEDGMQSSDFVHVDDVVQGTVSALEDKAGGTFNIGSGEETNIRNLAEKIKTITKSSSPIELNGRATDRPFRFFLDITKAKEVLGYSPRSLDIGLRKYFEEAQKYGSYKV